jgi:hypothetical protein
MRAAIRREEKGTDLGYKRELKGKLLEVCGARGQR